MSFKSPKSSSAAGDTKDVLSKNEKQSEKSLGSAERRVILLHACTGQEDIYEPLDYKCPIINALILKEKFRTEKLLNFEPLNQSRDNPVKRVSSPV